MLNIIDYLKKNLLILIVLLIYPIQFSNSKDKINNSYCEQTNYKNYNINNSQTISSIKIDVKNKKKWFRNSFQVISSKSLNNSISKKNKKRYKADIIIYFNNDKFCKFNAKIRLHGDFRDHIKLVNGNFLSSLDIKIDNGHANSFTNFKLFLPETRFGVNEILITELFRELKILSPKTFFVNAEINGIESKYLFQEKIVKEMLEKNLKREGPIFEGLEDSVNSDFIFTRIFLTRIVNSKWILKNKNNEIISFKSFNNLNKSYLAGESGFDRRFFIDHKFLNQDLEKFRVFEPILYSIVYPHGLGKNNRKFFYNILSGEFEPIYYDGDIKKITDFKYKENSEISKLIHPFIIKNSKFALKKLREISIENFYKKNQKNLINLSQNEVSEFFKNIEYNLIFLSNLKYSDLNFSKSLKNTFSKIDNNEKLVIAFKDQKIIYVCDKSFSNCYFEVINDIFLQKLISGSAKKNGQTYYLISYDDKLRNKFDPKTFKENFFNEDYSNNNINLVSIDNFKIVHNEDIQMNINESKKEINIKQLSNRGRILFENNEIKDWHIIFIGSTNYDETLTISNLGTRLLTGCVTFYNQKISGVKVTIKNSVCEDGLNIVSSFGNLKNITIQNSSSDAFDSDFSKVKIEELNIQKALNDCADFSGGSYIISKLNLSSCGDKAISVGEKSYLKVMNGIINDSTYGIVSKDSSITDITNVQLNDIDICYAAYNKKKEFSGGYLNIRNSNCLDFKINEEIDKFSKIDKDKIQN